MTAPAEAQPEAGLATATTTTFERDGAAHNDHEYENRNEDGIENEKTDLNYGDDANTSTPPRANAAAAQEQARDPSNLNAHQLHSSRHSFSSKNLTNPSSSSDTESTVLDDSGDHPPTTKLHNGTAISGAADSRRGGDGGDEKRHGAADESSRVDADAEADADASSKPPPPTDASPESTRTTLQTTIIMLSLCASVFLAALDMTIVTTALPTISQHFRSNAGYTWIGSAYLLANAAAVPSWGKFSDIWGRKPILLAAAGIFFVGSLLCAVSVSIGMLIAARAIQGVGGGGLITLVNICISDLFSMRSRGTYFGVIGMVWALASSIGPILGGVFTQQVSWRWCFYINLPITGTVSVALFFFLHLDTPKTKVWDGLKAVDWAGSLLVVGSTLMLLLGLEFGGVIHPWGSATVICLIVFGILVGVLFVVNEWKFARYPVMPLRLFKKRSNIAAMAVCFCHGYVFISGTYYLPLYFQAVLGASPLLSGVYLLPFAFSLSLVSAVTGIFIKKTGQYLPPIWFGLTVMCLGFGLLIDLPVTRNWPKIILYQIVAGIGVGPNFQSPLLALQSNISPRDIAAATATFGFIRNLSASISVVIGGVVFQNEMQKQSSFLTAALGPATASRLSGGSAGASVGIVASLPPAQRIVAREAFSHSLRIMWTAYVAFAALGVLVSLGISRQTLNKTHAVTKTGLAEEESKRLEEKERKRVGKEGKKAGNGGNGEKEEEV